MCQGENEIGLPVVLQDDFRVYYYSTYIQNVLLARDEDALNIAGCFAWSLIDNFEWADGVR